MPSFRTSYNAPGNGAFIQSCHEHCNGISGGWNNYKIDNVTMQAAVTDWWHADGTVPAAKHSYLPCQYHTTSPHKCNPTCY